jgi:hypothetical protein
VTDFDSFPALSAFGEAQFHNCIIILTAPSTYVPTVDILAAATAFPNAEIDQAFLVDRQRPAGLNLALFVAPVAAPAAAELLAALNFAISPCAATTAEPEPLFASLAGDAAFGTLAFSAAVVADKPRATTAPLLPLFRDPRTAAAAVAGRQGVANGARVLATSVMPDTTSLLGLMPAINWAFQRIGTFRLAAPPTHRAALPPPFPRIQNEFGADMYFVGETLEVEVAVETVADFDWVPAYCAPPATLSLMLMQPVASVPMVQSETALDILTASLQLPDRFAVYKFVVDSSSPYCSLLHHQTILAVREPPRQVRTMQDPANRLFAGGAVLSALIVVLLPLASLAHGRGRELKQD